MCILILNESKVSVPITGLTHCLINFFQYIPNPLSIINKFNPLQPLKYLHIHKASQIVILYHDPRRNKLNIRILQHLKYRQVNKLNDIDGQGVYNLVVNFLENPDLLIVRQYPHRRMRNQIPIQLGLGHHNSVQTIQIQFLVATLRKLTVVAPVC